jgi:hypothetical protein
MYEDVFMENIIAMTSISSQTARTRAAAGTTSRRNGLCAPIIGCVDLSTIAVIIPDVAVTRGNRFALSKSENDIHE